MFRNIKLEYFSEYNLKTRKSDLNKNLTVDKRNNITEKPTEAEIDGLNKAMKAVRVAELVWPTIHQHDFSMSALASCIYDKYWVGEVVHYKDVVNFWNQMHQVTMPLETMLYSVLLVHAFRNYITGSLDQRRQGRPQE